MQQIRTKRVKDQTRMGGENDPWENEQEIEIRPFEQIIYAQLGIRTSEWDTQTSGILRFKRITWSRPDDQT